MFANTAPPTFPGRLEAPTIATEAGARIGRSDATAPRWSRSAIRCLSFVGRSDVERHDHLAARALVTHRVARPLEHAQHRRVPGHYLRLETVDVLRGRDPRELLQHARRRPPSLVVVGDGEGDLGHASLAQAVEARDGHDAVPVMADQHDAVYSVGLRGVTRRRVRAPVAVKAHVAALGRETVVEGLDVLEIRRRSGPADASSSRRSGSHRGSAAR